MEMVMTPSETRERVLAMADLFSDRQVLCGLVRFLPTSDLEEFYNSYWFEEEQEALDN